MKKLKTKYFSVDLDLQELNKIIKNNCSKEDYSDLKIENKREFLELVLDEFGFELEGEDYGEDWTFSLVGDFDVIKVEIPDYSFGKHKDLDGAFSSYLFNLKNEGINLSGLLGVTQVSDKQKKIGLDWKYKEITGPALLMLRKMQ
jgi:hypothetical protein